MDQEAFQTFYRARGLDEKDFDKSVRAIEAFEGYLVAKGYGFEDVDATAVKEYIAGLVEAGENSLSNIRALAHYFSMLGRKEIYIYFTSILGGLGVMGNIRKRLAALEGRDMEAKVFAGLTEPPLGTQIEEMPAFTANFMERLEKNLDSGRCRRVLAGNNHGLPEAAMLEEKRRYQAAGSLDAYLKGRHERRVAELQRHCDENKVWYEQTITQRVVDFVRANQEILSAVRDGQKLFLTKIPYDPDRYLAESNPILKKYHACHCPFVRAAILDGGPRISPEWCYCSGGYAKFPYEVILDQKLEVELLETPLRGDDRCRFAITLPF